MCTFIYDLAITFFSDSHLSKYSSYCSIMRETVSSEGQQEEERKHLYDRLLKFMYYTLLLYPNALIIRKVSSKLNRTGPLLYLAGSREVASFQTRSQMYTSVLGSVETQYRSALSIFSISMYLFLKSNSITFVILETNMHSFQSVQYITNVSVRDVRPPCTSIYHVILYFSMYNVV